MASKQPSTAALRFAVLAADTVAFRLHDGVLEALLIPIENEHFAGLDGLPGGLISPNETAEEAAKRHLHEKGGIARAHLEQLYTFSGVDRDPRGRVVSVAYLALLSPQQAVIQERTRMPHWQAVKNVSRLGYDHNEVLDMGLNRLRARLTYTTIVQFLLPTTFTLTELQQAYEAILGTELDKRNFRKKVLALDILRETGEKRTEGLTRPAALYVFANKKLQVIEVL